MIENNSYIFSELKVCKSCKCEKTLFDFTKSKNYKDGFYPKCKSCKNISTNTCSLIIGEEKTCSKCKTLLPLSKFYKHSKIKSGYRSECIPCSKQYTACNSYGVCAICETVYQRKQQSTTCSKKCARANAKITRDKNSKIWAEQNPEKRSASAVKRRGKFRKANVSWANQSHIKAIYQKAAELSELTGIKHHVDHIVPLVNDSVCGLHCEDNLQILTGIENLTKNNSFDGTAENLSWRSRLQHED